MIDAILYLKQKLEALGNMLISVLVCKKKSFKCVKKTTIRYFMQGYVPIYFLVLGRSQSRNSPTYNRHISLVSSKSVDKWILLTFDSQAHILPLFPVFVLS